MSILGAVYGQNFADTRDVCCLCRYGGNVRTENRHRNVSAFNIGGAFNGLRRGAVQVFAVMFGND
jgi:hypothetical protein